MSYDEDDDDGRTPDLPGALTELARFAGGVFERLPKLRSVMITVAQYWNDEADDEVHTFVVASERATPVWPHECDHTSWTDDEPTPALPGEHCQYCTRELGYFGCADDVAIPTFAPYCHEVGSQDEPVARNHTPFAIARRTEGGVAIELVGTLYRPRATGATAEAPPLDDTAVRLLAEVCAAPDDEGRRRVLADHLIERGDPRGEYIALALADQLDAEGQARRDHLLETHRASWLGLLGAVVPLDQAQFERGLLAGVGVHASGDELASTAAHPIERLHLLPGSALFLPASWAPSLREVGPLGRDGLVVLARQPWRIERLHVALDSHEDAELLAGAELPALRHLDVSLAGDRDFPYELLQTAAWWPQLERVTWRGAREAASWLESLPELAPVPWIAVADTGGDGRRAGWELARSRDAIELTLHRWTPTSTRGELMALLAALPDLPIALVRSATWDPTADDVAAIAQAGRRAAIR